MLGRPPAAFAGDYLVTGLRIAIPIDRSHQHRLNDALGPYGFGQFCDALRIHRLPGLEPSRLQEVERKFLKRI